MRTADAVFKFCMICAVVALLFIFRGMAENGRHCFMAPNKDQPNDITVLDTRSGAIKYYSISLENPGESSVGVINYQTGVVQLQPVKVEKGDTSKK